MLNTKINTFIFSLLILFCVQKTFATATPEGHVTMPAFFGDNMVLQRGKPVKFWGTATPGYQFTIDFAGKEKKVKANATGSWLVIFPAQKAGLTTTLSVNCDHPFLFKNIIMGDVWVCSGQSNMDFNFGKTDSVNTDFKEEPNIRNINIPSSISNYPQTAIYKTAWTTCTKQSALTYSAVAYYFAQKLYRKTGIPIGIIHSSWGGTSIKAWMSEQAIAGIPAYQKLLSDFLKDRYTHNAIDSIEKRNDMQKWGNYKAIANNDKGYVDQYMAGNKGNAVWDTVLLPGPLHNARLQGFKGVIWLRKEIDLPDAVKDQLLTIQYGRIIGAEDMWINGIKIGGNSWFKSDNFFNLAVNVLKPGKNILVMRINDKDGNGSFWAAPGEMQIKSALAKEPYYPINGNWEITSTMPETDIDRLLVKLETTAPNTTVTSIYNVKINPLTPLPITGFLWYQGENDVKVAAFYKTLLQAMIIDWRKQFKQGNLPFIIVQLPLLDSTPDYNGWVEIRESQAAALQLPNTGMAVTIDTGTPDNIHPHNKKPVGERLANSALQMVYHQKDAPLCPLMQSVSLQQDGFHITFKQIGSGLISKGNVLKGFTIAGNDQHFIHAEAKIIKPNEIVVYSMSIKDPQAVRYAWLPDPADANLFNKQGMPTSPFRTDTWPLKTDGKVDDKN